MSCELIQKVQSLLGRQYDPDIELQIFIDGAQLILGRVIECAAKKRITLTEAEKETLTIYLAAHLYGSSDQYYSSRSTGRASGSYMGRTGLGLDGTLFGQNAKLLDPSNCLASMDSSFKGVKFEWLGKVPSEQIPYWRRD